MSELIEMLKGITLASRDPRLNNLPQRVVADMEAQAAEIARLTALRP